jgi:5'-deoxynucleotidase YfbR-like HD superfamily hydrolase
MTRYITTFSKVRFDPTDARPEDIQIRDVAHALSNMCRANGHFPRFYSVAQHCLHCETEAMTRGYSGKVRLACLLHDASEAYISDITRPVKASLPEYRAIEARLQELIYTKFLDAPLTAEERDKVGDVDNAMLQAEFMFFMGEKAMLSASDLKFAPSFPTEDFSVVESKFLNRFRRLTGPSSDESPDGA